MAADALSDERTQLEEFNDLLQEWHDNLVNDLPATDAGMPEPEEFFARWRHTVANWSTLINRQMPPALESDDVAEIRGDLVEIMGAVAEYDSGRPLDSLDTVMVHLEAIRHVVRDAIDGHVTREEDARILLRRLEDSLPRVRRKDLAELLSTSERSLQRILSADKIVEPSRRLFIVARLVELLRRGWTPEGVVAWFFRERRELDGRSPFDLLDDPAAERAILSAAKQGRAQHGA